MVEQWTENPCVPGSIPGGTTIIFWIPLGAIAQLVEQWTENPCVPGSIPGGTTQEAGLYDRLFLYLYFMEVIVYILYSKSVDRYYIGYSKDFEQRLLLHNDKVFRGSYSTIANDWVLYYKINCISIAQARRIESDHIQFLGINEDWV